MPRLELFPFRFRNPVTGKWVRARYKAERHVIAERYGEWEITGPAQIIEADPNARYFNPLRREGARCDDSIGNVGTVQAIARTARPALLRIAGVAR